MFTMCPYYLLWVWTGGWVGPGDFKRKVDFANPLSKTSIWNVLFVWFSYNQVLSVPVRGFDGWHTLKLQVVYSPETLVTRCWTARLRSSWLWQCGYAKFDVVRRWLWTLGFRLPRYDCVSLLQMYRCFRRTCWSWLLRLQVVSKRL